MLFPVREQIPMDNKPPCFIKKRWIRSQNCLRDHHRSILFEYLLAEPSDQSGALTPRAGGPGPENSSNFSTSGRQCYPCRLGRFALGNLNVVLLLSARLISPTHSAWITGSGDDLGRSLGPVSMTFLDDTRMFVIHRYLFADR